MNTQFPAQDYGPLEGALDIHGPGSGEPAGAPQIPEAEERVLLRAALNGLRTASESDEQWNAQCGIVCQQIENYLATSFPSRVYSEDQVKAALTENTNWWAIRCKCHQDSALSWEKAYREAVGEVVPEVETEEVRF